MTVKHLARAHSSRAVPVSSLVPKARQYPRPGPCRTGHTERPSSTFLMLKTPPSAPLLGQKTLDSPFPACVPLLIPEWLLPWPLSLSAQPLPRRPASFPQSYQDGLPSLCLTSSTLRVAATIAEGIRNGVGVWGTPLCKGKAWLSLASLVINNRLYS